MTLPPTAEHQRAADPTSGPGAWKQWGPYLAQRAWGTVREDYSEDGDAWNSFPHEHSRSRAYRWNEEGLCGFSDDHQFLCVALSFWNGRDPILKENFFGLTNEQGNHGEDVKEYWWYRDGTPSHSWMSWRYHYPMQEFPYAQLVAENARRGRNDPEFELLDTGVFDRGFWQIDVDIAKRSPEDLEWRVTVRNYSDQTETLHVLPTAWFRNSWRWGRDDRTPQMRWDNGTVKLDHEFLGHYSFTSDGEHIPLFCENETNAQRLYGTPSVTPFPKDAIGNHVVGIADEASAVNPGRVGTKVALHHQLTIDPGAESTFYFRIVRTDPPEAAHAAEPVAEHLATNENLFALRHSEADEFYREVIPKSVDDEARTIVREAFAGLCWSKQWYHFDVSHWLDGDPCGPPPPPGRGDIRDGAWRHLRNADVILMPDTWEYPWYATWDLAFQCVAYAYLDPGFAKEQLVLLCREWYMHPSGALPAYEWNFDDVNPPLHAWAARKIFAIDGFSDSSFLERIFHKLLLNFTWWVNKKDAEGNNLFEGGFLGLDNIGPVDRSKDVPPGATLEQSDGTAWMARYCLDMFDIALTLAVQDDVYEDLAIKFFEHFSLIAEASDQGGLWQEQGGIYRDQLRLADGTVHSIDIDSIVGLLPLTATVVVTEATRAALPKFEKTIERLLRFRQADLDVIANAWHVGSAHSLLSIAPPERVTRMLRVILDENQFLSPHGIRSLSKRHLTEPFEVEFDGESLFLGYEPGYSTSGLFGGNSNWRGPVWFPMNYLLIEAFRTLHTGFGNGLVAEFPVGTGHKVPMTTVANEVSDRLVSLFRRDKDGRRPCFGAADKLQNDPQWSEHLLFHEFFDGDDGRGLGATHQTGWTALVALLILERDR